jgi:hypothetical protein
MRAAPRPEVARGEFFASGEGSGTLVPCLIVEDQPVEASTVTLIP